MKEEKGEEQEKAEERNEKEGREKEEAEERKEEDAPGLVSFRRAACCWLSCSSNEEAKGDL